MSADRLEFELIVEPDTPIGRERIRVRHADGRVHEFRLHDYAQLYALPGAYEQIVSDRLACRSPQEVAAMLRHTVEALIWPTEGVRVIDMAAGNGVSGEALAAAGLRPVLGTDIVAAARTAALRDRPDLYERYLTLDLLALSDSERAVIGGLRANVLSCVAPVGDHAVPAAALAAAAALLEPDALVAYLHDVELACTDPVSAELWRERLGPATRADELVRRRYLHRRTISGGRYEMEAVIWRLRRPDRPEPHPQAQ